MFSVESTAYRANLARLVSPLRRIRPQVPFWQIGAHRIPTLWSLFRGLLKEAPTSDIRWRIRKLFEQHRHIVSASMAKEKLLQGYKWLDIFVKAKQGDPRLQALLQRYSRMIVAKSEKEEFKVMMKKELAWQARLRNRPILTGAYLRPTAYNGPLPRMSPQPEHISGMIYSRRIARTKRVERYTQLKAWDDDLREECAFEEELAYRAQREGKHLKRHFSDGNQPNDWLFPIWQAKSIIDTSFEWDTIRANKPYPPEMLAAIKEARREKVRNKTRELERERRGELTARAVRRRAAGPPAPILAKMSPEERKRDRIVRSVSEVGYIGLLKRRMGFRLRNPDAWKVELGREEDKEKLDLLAREIRDENRRRRRETGENEEMLKQ